MSSTDCKRAQRLWSEEFDGGASVPPAVAAHLDRCGECRAFRSQALLLREQFAAVPLPVLSPMRDQELLALLHLAAGASHGGVWTRWWQSLRSPTVPALGAVGFAAFAVTLITAHLLTVLPSERVPHGVPGGASARGVDGPPNTDTVERWLASPQPRLLPLRAPRPEKTAPAPDPANPLEPRQRGSSVPHYLGRLS